MPGGRLPADPVSDLVPDFVIEVLRLGNTRPEMARMRREYFHAGVRLVWMIDPRRRTVAVFTAAESVSIAQEFDRIDGGVFSPAGILIWKSSLRNSIVDRLNNPVPNGSGEGLGVSELAVDSRQLTENRMCVHAP